MSGVWGFGAGPALRPGVGQLEDGVLAAADLPKPVQSNPPRQLTFPQLPLEVVEAALDVAQLGVERRDVVPADSVAGAGGVVPGVLGTDAVPPVCGEGGRREWPRNPHPPGPLRG